MCECGDDVLLNLPIPARDSYTGEARWAEKGVDRCIAPIVKALIDGGVLTAGCCCGHGKEWGSILLQDGRWLYILSSGQAEAYEKSKMISSEASDGEKNT